MSDEDGKSQPTHSERAENGLLCCQSLIFDGCELRKPLAHFRHILMAIAFFVDVVALVTVPIRVDQHKPNKAKER